MGRLTKLPDSYRDRPAGRAPPAGFFVVSSPGDFAATGRDVVIRDQARRDRQTNAVSAGLIWVATAAK